MNKTITIANIYNVCLISHQDLAIHKVQLVFLLFQEISFGFLDTRDTGLLHASERLLSDIFLPALSKTSTWGELSTKQGQHIRQEFMKQLENFITILVGAQDSLNDSVVLKKCETVNLDAMTTPTDYINAANSSDVLAKIEELVAVWMRQIEQVNKRNFSLLFIL